MQGVLTIAWEATVDNSSITMAMALVWLSLALCLMTLMCAIIVHVRGLSNSIVEEKFVELIEIFDSPPPTRSFASPKTATSKRRALSARRAGKRRLGAVRKRLLRSYDPCLPNHCGFQAILKAANRSVSLRSVLDLRERVAEAFLEAYKHNGAYSGIRIRDLPAYEHLTLSAYLKGIRTDMWASPAELAIASDLLETPVMMYMNDGCFQLGKGVPKHAIVLKGKHFILAKINKPPARMMSTTPTTRAGMRRGQLPPGLNLPAQHPHEEEQIPDWAVWQQPSASASAYMQQQPQQLQQQQHQQYALSVHTATSTPPVTMTTMTSWMAQSMDISRLMRSRELSYTVEVDTSRVPEQRIVALQLHVPEGYQIGELMFTLSNAVAKPLNTLTLLDHATMRAPVGPIEKDEKFILVYHDAVYSLYVHLEPEGYFVLHFKDDMTKAIVETKIGALLSVLPHFFDLKDAADQPWIPTRDLVQHVWVNLTVPRGGMRTVSSTVDFVPTQQDEPQEPQAQQQEVHPPRSAAGT